MSDTGCLRNYRKPILKLHKFVLGRLRDLQYIYVVINETHSIYKLMAGNESADQIGRTYVTPLHLERESVLMVLAIQKWQDGVCGVPVQHHAGTMVSKPGRILRVCSGWSSSFLKSTYIHISTHSWKFFKFLNLILVVWKIKSIQIGSRYYMLGLVHL